MTPSNLDKFLKVITSTQDLIFAHGNSQIFFKIFWSGSIVIEVELNVRHRRGNFWAFY